MNRITTVQGSCVAFRIAARREGVSSSEHWKSEEDRRSETGEHFLGNFDNEHAAYTIGQSL